MRDYLSYVNNFKISIDLLTLAHYFLTFILSSVFRHISEKCFVLHCSCPERNILSSFVYDKENGTADATLYSMFKFPDSNRVHFQCDILLCPAGECDDMICDDSPPGPLQIEGSNQTRPRGPLAQARAFQPRADALLQPAEDGTLMASTSVFVVEPGAPVGKFFLLRGDNLKIE